MLRADTVAVALNFSSSANNKMTVKLKQTSLSLTFPLRNLILSLLLLFGAELLKEGINGIVDGEDSVLVDDGRPALGAGPEVSPRPPVTVLPLSQTEPAERVAAVEDDGADEEVIAGNVLLKIPLQRCIILR